MAAVVPSRGSDQFNLRFPEGLRDRIRDVAEANGRSMNAEIVMRLQQTLDEERMIGASSSEAGTDSYLEKLTAERLKFESLMSQYIRIFQGYTPEDIKRLFDNYETLRKRLAGPDAENVDKD